MKRLIIAASLALAGCTTPSAPFEARLYQTISTADASYIAASRLGQSLVIAGTWDKAKFKAWDQSAYDALVALRASRDSLTLYQAQTNFDALIAEAYRSAK